MPEIPIPKSPEISKAMSKKSLYPGDSFGRDGKTFIGKGTEKFVYMNPLKPGKAISIYSGKEHPSPKQIFYLQKIYHTLFPDNFPAYHAAFNETSSFFSRRPPVYSAYVTEYIEPNDRLITHPFTNVGDKCDDWSLPLPIDPYYQNFVTGQDGKERYIDTLSKPRRTSRLNCIPHFMKKQGYSEHDQRRVQAYIGRYKANAPIEALKTAITTYIRGRRVCGRYVPVPDKLRGWRLINLQQRQVHLQQ